MFGTFILQFVKTILWTIMIFSVATTSFGQPKSCASSVFIRPHLNSANQSMMVNFRVAQFRMLIELNFSFDSFFLSQKALFYQHSKFFFSPVFKQLQICLFKNTQISTKAGSRRSILLTKHVTFVNVIGHVGNRDKKY